MRKRQSVGPLYLGAVLALVLPLSASADTIWTESFDAPDQLLASYSGDYTVTNATAEIVSNQLRVHSSTTTGQNGVTSASGLFAAPGPGSFVMGDVHYSWPAGGGASNVFLKLGGNVAHRASNQNRHGFWDNGWQTGGSSNVTGSPRRFAALYVGGPGTSQTVHTFVDKLYNTSFTDDDDGAGQMVGPTGDQLHLRLQVGSGKENRSDIYAEYDNVSVFVLEHSGAGAAAAVKSGLTLGYADDFNRPDSPTLGPAWTEESNHFDRTESGLSGNRVRLAVTNGSGTPWVRTMLDLTDASILGRGLAVGEYVEFDLLRGQDRGFLGVKPDFARHNGFDHGTGALRAWADRFDQSATWNAISPGGVSYDPEQGLTLGTRLDYADGEVAVLSYYVNGDYAGSWLFDTPQTTVDTIGFFCQSDQTGTFWFDDLRVYTAPTEIIPEPGTAGLAGLIVCGLGGYLRRRRPRR